MMAQAFAAKEAGVVGNVGDTSLGVYEYTKWGSTDTCVAYPMQVAEVTPEAD